MRMVVHLKYLLLLSCQVLWLSITVHNCKAHGTWHKNVIVSIILASCVRRLHKVILIWRPVLNILKLLVSILRVLTAIVSYISSILILDAAFLIMAVKILNVQ